MVRSPGQNPLCFDATLFCCFSYCRAAGCHFLPRADEVMPDTADSILKRLQRDGSSAQELLPVYQDPAHEALWRQNPELYRVFTRRLISEGNPTRAFDIAREGLAVHTGDHELKYLLALALARGGNIRGAEKCLAELLPLSD